MKPRVGVRSFYRESTCMHGCATVNGCACAGRADDVMEGAGAACATEAGGSTWLVASCTVEVDQRPMSWECSHERQRTVL